MRNRPLRTLGIRLREARERKELLQREVAEKIGCHTMTVSKYERDAQDPSSKNLADLAKLYDVSVDWLLTGHEDIIHHGLPDRKGGMKIVMSQPSLVIGVIEGTLSEEAIADMRDYTHFIRRRYGKSPKTKVRQERRNDTAI